VKRHKEYKPVLTDRPLSEMIAVILRATTVRFICFLVHKSNND
jgi:hypothetical protein